MVSVSRHENVWHSQAQVNDPSSHPPVTRTAPDTEAEVSLELILFVDNRSQVDDQVQKAKQFLEKAKTEGNFDLQIIQVEEKPYLAEYYKLITTPCLMKVHPRPQQALAGRDLLAQLEHWWPWWQWCTQTEGEQYLFETSETNDPPKKMLDSVTSVGQLMEMSDEIFRLQQENKHLQEQLKFKDRIMAMLAHDLRTPLTAASLAVETLEITHNNSQSTSITPAFRERLIKQARHQLRSIDRMITDLLETATGHDVALHIKPQGIDVGVLCEDVIADLQERIKTKSLEIKTDIPHDLPKVYADAERIRQVISNLLDNAIKYTPEGGKIAISILHRTTQKIQVSICDNGPGIPLENRDRIFEDHFRLERDELKDGYGIGLALCQRIISAHYGQIWVDAGTHHQGSCFHFTLPVVI